MKYAVVIYHKNVNQYPAHWIEKCLDSLVNQTDQDFSVFELNYGPITQHSVLGKRFEGRRYLDNIPFETHAEAMNFIFGKAFLLHDVVFNTNIDDYYHPQRIEQQKKWLQYNDIVSSNYQQVVHDTETNVENLASFDVPAALLRNHNVVSNPSHAMHKRVFEKQKFDGSLIPYEDLEYWKMAVKNGFTIGIVPQVLHYYRIHGNQVGKTNH